MKKNQIIAIGLSLIFLYGVYNYSMDIYRLFKDIDDLSETSMSFGFYMQIFAHLFHIVGILHFFLTGYERSGLLRMGLLYDVFTWFIFFPIWVASNFIFGQDGSKILFFVILSFLTTGFKCYALYFLLTKCSPQLDPLGDGNHTFSEVKKRDRFFHRIFDLSIIALVIYPSSEYIARFMIKITQSENSFLYITGNFFQSDASFYPSVYFLVTLYYLTTEGIFNTSIGKTIMGNMVVDNIAGRPYIGQRIGRTFARLIPFEALSFIFGARGWHDDLTDTYVVKISKTNKDNL